MLAKEEIKQFISDDKMSPLKRLARQGVDYYEAKHDILGYRVFYYNSDGELTEDTTRSNIKISHPFFSELVDQEVQYMLSNKDKIIKSDIPELQAELDEYFNDDFIAELTDTLTGAIVKGHEFLYAYKKSDNRIGFQNADSLGVIEVRGEDTRDGNGYVIYYYTDTLKKKHKQVTRIQVWNEKQVSYFFDEGDGKIKEDKSIKINPRPHVLHKEEDGEYYENLGYIPFFRLDNNKKQTSGLAPIKDLIDDYDMMSCGLSNNLADFDHPLHVVKGFQGSDFEELAKNLRTKKMIGVGESGGVEVRTIDIPYQARLTKMEQDEKNIYRFGMGFNSAQVGDGNITNIVIKSRYALLDLKCNKLEIRLRKFLRKLCGIVLEEINRVGKTGYQMSDIWLNLTREVITNAADNAQIELLNAQKQQTVINTLLSVSNVLDDETVVQNICDALDIDYEAIKDKLPADEEKDNLNVLAALEDGDGLNE